MKKTKSSGALAAIADHYLEAATMTNTPSSLATKADLLRLHILPTLGARRVESINDAAIEELAERMVARGARPKTFNNMLSCLRRVLVFAEERGLVSALPCFPWQYAPKPRVRSTLSEDEAERLIAAAGADWRAMIELARAGLRLGELLGLRWNDLDLTAGTVTLRRTLVRGRVGSVERHRPRKIAVGQSTVDALLAHRHDRGVLVFCNEQGTALTVDQTHWPLWRACDRAGLPRLGWDVLRKRPGGRS